MPTVEEEEEAVENKAPIELMSKVISFVESLPFHDLLFLYLYSSFC
jgi:hypothetical protein